MTTRLEFDLRAALCRQFARNEPANEALWMAEAGNWSCLSKLCGDAAQRTPHLATGRTRWGSAVSSLMLKLSLTVWR